MPVRPTNTKPLIEMSRQHLWQRLKKEAGLCTTCGKRKMATGSLSRCRLCILKSRMYNRKRGSHNVKKNGGRGRPLLFKDPE